MVSCWKRTNQTDPVPERLKNTLQKAGISITITSATDFLSFWIGVITPFEAIRIFCIYIATCILLVYLMQITMFAACMAYAGYAEEKRRHGLLCCIQVLTPSQAKSKSVIHQLICSGGGDDADAQTIEPTATSDGQLNKQISPQLSHDLLANEITSKTEDPNRGQRSFIADCFARAINNPWIKATVLLGFAAYLSVATWGLWDLHKGLDIRNLCRYDSYASRYYDSESKYFRQYRVQLVITGQLNYFNKTFQEELESMLTTFETNSHMAGRTLTESWLRSFLSYIEYAGIEISDQKSFIDEVKKFIQGTHYELDVQFTPDGGYIHASRFLLQTEDVPDADLGTTMMSDLRELADSFPFNVTVFNPYFLYFDQFLLVLPYTCQCIAVAAIVMMLVAVIFLPDVSCAVCIALAVISIEVGVVGFMSLWGVKLDAIAMINLIMCIGFSVDYSAHIAHAYLSASTTMPTQLQLRYAFATTGLPILQGAFSTILAILPLLMVPSFIAMAFFKIIFLVTLLGAVHALILLPVLLSLIRSKWWSSRCARANKVDPYPKPPLPESSLTVSDLGRQLSVTGIGIVGDCFADEDTGIGTSADDCSDSSWSTPKALKLCKSLSANGNLETRHRFTKDQQTQTVFEPSAHSTVSDDCNGGYDTDIDEDEE